MTPVLGGATPPPALSSMPPLPPPPPGVMLPGGKGRPLILQPMGVGETLDAAISLCRRFWKPLMAIAAIIEIPYEVIEQWVRHVSIQPVLIGDRLYTNAVPLHITLGILLVNLLLITPILRGAMTRAVAGAYMGETPAWGESLRFAFSKLWVMLGALLLSDLVIAGGFILLIVPGLIFIIRYYFVSMAVVVEDVHGTKALSRSWHLSAGRFWRILGTVLLVSIIVGVFSFAAAIPVAILTAHHALGSFTWALQATLTSVLVVITAPFGSAVAVLMYFDSRIRKEGFDIAVLAREIG